MECKEWKNLATECRYREGSCPGLFLRMWLEQLDEQRCHLRSRMSRFWELGLRVQSVGGVAKQSGAPNSPVSGDSWGYWSAEGSFALEV